MTVTVYLPLPDSWRRASLTGMEREMGTHALLPGAYSLPAFLVRPA